MLGTVRPFNDGDRDRDCGRDHDYARATRDYHAKGRGRDRVCDAHAGVRAPKVSQHCDRARVLRGHACADARDRANAHDHANENVHDHARDAFQPVALLFHQSATLEP